MIALYRLFLFLFLSIPLSNGYPFPTCDSTTTNSELVLTQNGYVSGNCYNVTALYSYGTSINTGVSTWLGIPYAEPPINQNRFRRALPKTSYSGIRAATNFSRACIQGGRPESAVSEDCLYLNLYVRRDSFQARNTALKPILIWIHGGAYVSGAGSDFEPSTLVAMNDIVVVTINYRLGVFGFMHLTASGAFGNQGFLDQNLAIQWVYNNANSFGGDNTKITIAGQSSGAANVNSHLYYSPSWPYFRNAIMESSGVAGPNNVNLLLTQSEANNRSREVFTRIGCTSSVPTAVLTCAQSANAFAILNATAGVNFNRLVLNYMEFSNTFDELTAQNNFKKCNIITGFNSDELPQQTNLNFDSFNSTITPALDNIIPYTVTPAFISAVLVQYFGTSALLSLDQRVLNYPYTLTQILSDAFFVCPSIRTAQIYADSNQRTWLYEFKYKNSQSDRPYFYYAAHGDEIPYLFARPQSNEINSTYVPSYEDRIFSEKMIAYWMNFIKNNDPNFPSFPTQAVYWQQFTTTVGQQILFQNYGGIQSQTGYSSHRCNFWNARYFS